jgi:hypothetical protein
MWLIGVCRQNEAEVASEGAETGPGVAVQDVEDTEFEYMEFDPFSFIKSLPPLEQVVPQWRKTLLPRQTRQNRRKTLVSHGCSSA